jgi:pyrroloquinoline quinone (PQQ) biosynthesis protein C
LWPAYLIQQHEIIRATVPLTEAALTRSRGLLDTDPLAAPLSSYLEEHVEEELHHDETLLDDIEVLGVDRASVVARMPSPAVAALVGAQYYWILHYHPVAFLGFVALMEGHPPTPELIETLIARTGFPREAFRTYIEHGELDPGHRDHLDRTIDSLALTREHESALGLSAIASAGLAARALAELLDD